MRLEDQTIQDFITLVETQWPLFAECQGELEQLQTSLPSDREGMSDAIIDWCESHPAILDAMDAMSEQQQRDRVPGSHGHAPPPPDPKVYQEMLDNEIRRNQSSSKTKP
ncbi:hypothetical protein [Microcoleus sp. FACHB-68]|uniref:hypothetical protein n=1 Tax=Microcoleus sp. FACHB-68 TaxID=2692826 RepID=UPI0016878A54|nr:hypothetical protein [Microcoleus sp. FACHB-68]MBD1940317.1 hypothetical protein [Microcoleus sp. FACHB-68]